MLSLSASIQTPSSGNEKKMNKQWVNIGNEIIQNLVRMHEVWWMWLITWCESQCFLTSELYSTGRGPRSRLKLDYYICLQKEDPYRQVPWVLISSPAGTQEVSRECPLPSGSRTFFQPGWMFQGELSCYQSHEGKWIPKPFHTPFQCSYKCISPLPLLQLRHQTNNPRSWKRPSHYPIYNASLSLSGGYRVAWISELGSEQTQLSDRSWWDLRTPSLTRNQ